jgi:hypothetical protein
MLSASFLEEVAVAKGPRLAAASVTKPTKKRVADEAAARGISESRLVKFWIKDRIHQEDQEAAACTALASIATWGHRPSADLDALRELLTDLSK